MDLFRNPERCMDLLFGPNRFVDLSFVLDPSVYLVLGLEIRESIFRTGSIQSSIFCDNVFLSLWVFLCQCVSMCKGVYVCVWCV